MGESRLSKPITALAQLQELVLPGAKEGAGLALQMQLHAEDLPLRDMAAYLELTDHIYGRLQSESFRSYAMRPRDQLRFSDAQPGSIILTIPGLVQDASPLVMLWLCLKYLPSAVESVAKAYDSYQQGALAKANRKRIRVDMERDAALAQMPKERRAQLAALVAGLLESDSGLITKASRFSREHVYDLYLRLK